MALDKAAGDWHAPCKEAPRSREQGARVVSYLPAPSRSHGTLRSFIFFYHGEPYMQRRNFIRTTLAATLAAAGLTMGLHAQAADTIKVGVLHSLSGTMAISETSLKDVALMTIDEINAKGGVMVKKLEAVVVDPASNRPLL